MAENQTQPCPALHHTEPFYISRQFLLFLASEYHKGQVYVSVT